MECVECTAQGHVIGATPMATPMTTPYCAIVTSSTRDRCHALLHNRDFINHPHPIAQWHPHHQSYALFYGFQESRVLLFPSVSCIFPNSFTHCSCLSYSFLFLLLSRITRYYSIVFYHGWVIMLKCLRNGWRNHKKR